MKNIGISIYLDFYELEDCKNYAKKAAEMGYTKVFVSLILSNHGFHNARKIKHEEFVELMLYCDQLGLEVATDINKEVFEELGATIENIKPLSDLKISILRLDGGFTPEETIALTNNEYNIKIEVNASIVSTIGDKYYDELKQFLDLALEKGKIENILACHNWFPLIGTGLTFEDVRITNNLFKEYGVKIGGFCASQTSEKQLHLNGNGICTIERHRYLAPEISIMEFKLEGFDYVLFGDTMASDAELLNAYNAFKSSAAIIPVYFNNHIDQEVLDRILEIEFISRLDQCKDFIRGTKSRGLDVKPCHMAPRKKLDVCIQNANSDHYVGEVSIMLNDLNQTFETNVIGFIHHDYEQLIYKLRCEVMPYKLINGKEV